MFKKKYGWLKTDEDNYTRVRIFRKLIERDILILKKGKRIFHALKSDVIVESNKYSLFDFYAMRTRRPGKNDVIFGRTYGTDLVDYDYGTSAVDFIFLKNLYNNIFIGLTKEHQLKYVVHLDNNIKFNPFTHTNFRELQRSGAVGESSMRELPKDGDSFTFKMTGYFIGFRFLSRGYKKKREVTFESVKDFKELEEGLYFAKGYNPSHEECENEWDLYIRFPKLKDVKP